MMEVLRARVENPLLKKFDEFAQAFADARIFPDAIQIRVGLQNVQVVVHGFFFAHVPLAQPRARAGLRPVAVANFDVAAEFFVVRVAFDQFKQFLRALQRRRVAEGAMKFRQRINAERLAVGFFGIVRHAPGVVQPPERAAVFRVPGTCPSQNQTRVWPFLEKVFPVAFDRRRKMPRGYGN